MRKLERYSEIYKLLGVIELELRTRVPNTLSKPKSTEPWFQYFEFDTYPNYLLKIALKRNSDLINGVESYLPFSFWVRIFRLGNFEKVWQVRMFEIFPNLANPNSLKSYRKISKKLKSAQKVRNKIAHFDLVRISTKSPEFQDLIFLIEALGIEAQLNPKDLYRPIPASFSSST